MVTCPRNLEMMCHEEILSLLEEIGDEDSTHDIQHTEFSGILVVSSSLGHCFVVSQIKKIILEEPWRVRFCLKIVPLHKLVDTSEESIVDCAVQLALGIDHDSGETYRITVKKRGSALSCSSMNLVEKIAQKIDAPVSLENYTWNLLVEVIGEKTGISLIRNESEEILSLEKTKRSLSE